MQIFRRERGTVAFMCYSGGFTDGTFAWLQSAKQTTQKSRSCESYESYDSLNESLYESLFYGEEEETMLHGGRSSKS